jgi:hypothetical protein
MQPRFNALAVASFVALAIAIGPSCSSSPGGGGATTTAPPSTPVPQSQLPDRIVSTYCNGYRGCCTSSGFAFNQTACDAFFRGGATTMANNVCPYGKYDPVAAGDCYQAFETAYAACQKRPASGPGTAACSRMCTGTVPIGGSCGSDGDCAPSAEGTVECSVTSPNVCTLRRPAKAGDRCDTTCATISNSVGCSAPNPDAGVAPLSTPCLVNDGLFCSSTSSTCQPVAPIGGACSDSFGCVLEGYCNTLSGKCVAKSAVGGACISSECVDGTYCRSGTCQPKKAAGAACTSFIECAGTCNTTTKLCEGPGATPLKVSADICNGAFSSN